MRVATATTAILWAGTLLQACAPDRPNPDSSIIPQGARGVGFLEVKLTDQPIDGITEVNVCFARVDVTFTDGDDAPPATVFDQVGTFDLLKLRNGVTATLGIAELPAGEIVQIRVILCDEGHFVVEDGNEVPLRVPSGEQTGIKLTRPGGFEISENVTTTVVIDFDAEQSLHIAPGQGGYMLRPVVRLVDGLRLTIDEPLNGARVAAGPLTVRGTAVPALGDTIAFITVVGAQAAFNPPVWEAEIETPNETGEFAIVVEATTSSGIEAVLSVVFVIATGPSQLCCVTSDLSDCTEVPAGVGCPVDVTPPPPPPAEHYDAVRAKVAEEEATPAASISTLGRPPVTLRGVLALSMTHPRVEHVVVAEILDELAELITLPDGSQDIRTRCLVKVLESFRGDAAVGDELEVIFPGGVVSPEVFAIPAHGPLCGPLDVRIMPLYSSEGVLRITERGVPSLMSEQDFHDHQAYVVLTGVAAELGGAP